MAEVTDHNQTEEKNDIQASKISIVLQRQKQNLPSVGVAACIPRKREGLHDSICFTLIHYSFLDDPRYFTNLDTLLNRLGDIDTVVVGCTDSLENPKKSADSDSSQRKKELHKIFDNLKSKFQDDNVTLHSLPKSVIHDPTSSLDNFMSHLLGSETSKQLAYRGDRGLNDSPLAKIALWLLIEKNNLTTFGEEGNYEVKTGSLHSHLNMDGVAAKCINLLPPKNAGAASIIGGTYQNNSVFGVLNRTITKMGPRLLENWIRQPLVDKEKIDERLDVVETLVMNGTGRDKLRSMGLKGIYDLDKLSLKLGNGKGESSSSLELLYHAYTFIDQHLPRIIEILQDIDGNQSDCKMLHFFLGGLREVFHDLQNLKDLVNEVLDFDQAPQSFLVRAEFDQNFFELRKELNDVENELAKIHENINAEWSEISGNSSGHVRIEDISADINKQSMCWQFRLPDTNDEKILRSRMSRRVQVHRILKNGVYFSTKELRELGTHKQDLMAKYTSKQGQIVRDAMEVASTFVPIFEKASHILSQIDVLASFAFVAAYSPKPYCRPTVTDTDDSEAGIFIEKARHPCVELQEGVDFIPNDFTLQYKSSSFLVLTGPNMGGKSTYIRSLGAIVAMAQIGSFIPASSGTINIVDKILARVGAGDAQQKGISTFMAEMLEASSILQRATRRSLIIVDELGRGTSTFDGFGLAWAISEHIAKNIGAITLFATHFHELTRLASKLSCVQNAHVTAKNIGGKELTFLYEVVRGPCLESFGIQVAEMANFPPVVVADAKQKAEELETFIKPVKIQKVEYSSIKDGRDSGNFIKKFKSLPLKSLKTNEEKIAALKAILF